MAIKNLGLSMVSELVVSVWDGLDECEISRLEILSQSGPVLHGGYSTWIYSLANTI